MLINKLFKDFLVLNGIVSEAQGTKYQKDADDKKELLHQYLYNNTVIRENDIYSYLAKFFNTEFVEVNISEVDINLCKLFPKSKLIKYGLIPYKETDNKIYFVLSNPLRLEELNEFKINTKKRFENYFVTETNMQELINYVDSNYENEVAPQVKVAPQTKTNNETKVKEMENTRVNYSFDDSTNKLAKNILLDAAKLDASDIHIEMNQFETILRYRVNGKLIKHDKISTDEAFKVVMKFKALALMNIAEKTRPQFSKFQMDLEGNKYNFKITSIPTLNGENLVIKVYSLDTDFSTIQSIGLNDEEKDDLAKMINKPLGLILISGHKDSGKSHTQYALLRYLSNEDRKVVSLEEIIESRVDGITQIEYQNAENLKNILSNINDLDVDVVSLGDLNHDSLKAHNAVNLALEGKLVLLTLEANTSAEAISEILDLGVRPEKLAPALNGVIGQTLIRKLCPSCKGKHITESAEMDMLAISSKREIFEMGGCNSCNHSGYDGRICLFDILLNDETLKEEIAKGEYDNDKISQLNTDSASKFISSTRNYVLDGETSMDEYNILIDSLIK